jgi:hypothetical protein
VRHLSHSVFDHQRLAQDRNPQIAAGPSGIVVTWSENTAALNGPEGRS